MSNNICVRQLKSWKNIENFLNEDVKLLLVKQIIFSEIDYCNSLFVNVPKSLLRHLDCVINSALRFVHNVRYSQHYQQNLQSYPEIGK